MPASPRLAKLTRPRSEGLLHRGRLFVQIDEARKKSALWIAGPPGAGKTSLVASYLEFRKCPAVWYQVDRNDSDPATFFYYLGIAMSGLAGKKAKPLPLFTEDFVSDLAGFSRRFFRDFFGAFAPDSILVLDNYQEVEERSAFHTVMKAALEELPDSLHIIAISRSDPPVEFARVRATQRLAQLGWDSLKLTREETATIADNPELDEATLSQLQDQTTGWAAGVVLMRERLRQTGQLKNLGNTENLETIFDYFADQLFDAADKQTQAMLLRMAYLPRLTASTAEIISGNPVAGQLLADLAKRNLFTDRRYGEETSFQFHALFRAFLLDKARQQLGAAEHQKIAHSAAALLQTTGQLEDAFSLYVSGAAWDAIIRLVITQGDRLLEQGRTQTLRQWVNALPLDKVRQTPWMSYWLALSLVGQDHNEARSILEAAFQTFTEQDDLEGQIRAAEAALRIFRLLRVSVTSGSEIQKWIDRMTALLPNIAGLENEAVQCSALSSLCSSTMYHRPGDASLASMIALLENAARETRDDRTWAGAWTALLGLYFWRGNISKCEDIITNRDHLFDDPAVHIASRLWWVFWKMTYRTVFGSPAQLSSLLDRAKSLADDSGLTPFLVDFERLNASAHLHGGNYDKALEILRERVEPNIRRATSHNHALLPDLYARCALVSGDANAARDYSARALTTALEMGWGAGKWLMLTTRVQIHLAMGDIEAARDELSALRREYPQTGNPSFEFTFNLNDALVTLREGKADAGIRLLRGAVEYGSEHSLTWVMGWCPPQFADLFALALDQGIEVQYVRKFVEGRHLSSPRPDIKAWPWRAGIHAFGSLHIDRSGNPVAPGQKPKHKVLDLLKVIVALGATQVSRDQLIDSLWPDADGDAAQKNLEITVHRLRKLLGGDDLVLVKDGRISLNRKYCYLDVWAFEYRTHLFRNANSAVPGYAEKGQAAIALYPGHLLASERELPATLGRRKALRQEWIETVISLGAHYESGPHPDAAMALYALALKTDPVAEELYRRLMSCHKRSGNTAAAADTYRLCEEQMLSALGMKPSVETANLYRAISGNGR